MTAPDVRNLFEPKRFFGKPGEVGVVVVTNQSPSPRLHKLQLSHRRVHRIDFEHTNLGCSQGLPQRRVDYAPVTRNHDRLALIAVNGL